MELAPIAFFAYKRPEHTFKALTSLAHCELASQSKLFIFCDGAKSPEDMENVRKVRQIVGSVQWCGQVDVTYQEKNLGLANSIIQGVTFLCERYGRIIVIEDDLVLSPHFLSYMNKALERYQFDGRVMQVSGYMFPIKISSETDAIFLPLSTTWGWGTWQRAWQYFDAEMSGCLEIEKNRGLRKKFDLNGAYPYYDMIRRQKQGKIDSWGIRWYLTTFQHNGLTLYPKISLVQNIGFDASGTNCGITNIFNTSMGGYEIANFPHAHPDSLIFNRVCLFLKNKKNSLIKKLFNKIGYNKFLRGGICQ